MTNPEPMKLLVVEDDESCVEFIEVALGSLCRELKTTGFLKEALRIVTPDYDAIWLDLVLHDAAAIQTLAAVPEFRRKAPGSTLIVVSGHGERYREEAMKAGADAYAAKMDLDGFNKASVVALMTQAAVHAMNRGVDVNRILARVSAFFTHLHAMPGVVQPTEPVTHPA